jgi:hypothetical protein
MVRFWFSRRLNRTGPSMGFFSSNSNLFSAARATWHRGSHDVYLHVMSILQHVDTGGSPKTSIQYHTVSYTATTSKTPHNAPTQPFQGYSTYMSQKAPHPNPTLPQETHPTAQRHWETPPDPRATSHRTATAMDKAFLMSPYPLRHAEDHYKSSHRLPKAQSLKPLLLGLAHRRFLKK